MAYEQRSTSRPMGGVAGGFVLFAAALMVMSGVFGMLEGIAAIIDDELYVVTPDYTYDLDVSTWGWIHLATGAVVMLAGFGLFSGVLWARIIAMIVAVTSAVINFFYIPYYPFWSILIIAVNIVVLWALAVYTRDEAT